MPESVRQAEVVQGPGSAVGPSPPPSPTHKQLVGPASTPLPQLELRVVLNRGRSWRKLACNQRWIFPVGTTQEPCGVNGLGEGPGELSVRPCRNGRIAKLGAGAGILLEGLLGMVCNRTVLALHCVQPQVVTSGLHVLDSLIKGSVCS